MASTNKEREMLIAQRRVEGLEDEFPAASWLPVIFQNPAVLAPTWQGFLN